MGVEIPALKSTFSETNCNYLLIREIACRELWFVEKMVKELSDLPLRFRQSPERHPLSPESRKVILQLLPLTLFFSLFFSFLLSILCSHLVYDRQPAVKLKPSKHFLTSRIVISAVGLPSGTINLSSSYLASLSPPFDAF